MRASKYRRGFVVMGSVMTVSGFAAVSSASVVVVNPSNMNGWSFGSFDNNFSPVNSGPYFGAGALVTGPQPAPLGTGSAHLATPSGHGDGGEILATNNFNGTALSAITSLNYSAYMANNGPNNNQQFPYLNVAISTDGNPIAANGSNLDFVTFEPPYQTAATGNPSLPDQGATQLSTWQVWNAGEGGWYDGVIGGSGGANVEPLSAFLAAYPDATIADPSGVFPGFEGIDLQVGFADSGSTFDGYVDDFALGTNEGTTTYDFEPASVPEPASFGLMALGGSVVLLRRRKRLA